MTSLSCARQAADSVLALDASGSLDVFSVFEAAAIDGHLAY